MVIRECILLMMLSPGSAFVLMPKNATGRVAGDLTLLNRHAYRWDMPEAHPTLDLALILALAQSCPHHVALAMCVAYSSTIGNRHACVMNNRSRSKALRSITLLRTWASSIYLGLGGPHPREWG